MAETTTITGFAPQIAPMAEEAFTEAQNIFQQRMGEDYQRPETPLFTPFTQPELEAQQQTLDIAAGPLGRPTIQEAMGITRAGVSGVGSLIPGLMSPYTEQVADRAKQRFTENYQRQVINPLMAKATAAGGLRGSRLAVEGALAEERRQRGLADIDIQLLDKAYQQAALLGEQQRRRELAGAPQLSRLGLADVGQELLAPELQAGVGATQRGQLDLARRAELGQELAQQRYPETTLQQYLNFLGLGRAPSQTTTIRPDIAEGGLGPTGPQRTSTLQRVGEIAEIVGKAPEIIESGKSIYEGGKAVFDFLGTLSGGGSVGGLSSLPAVRMQEGGRPPSLDTLLDIVGSKMPPYAPSTREIDLLRAKRNLETVTGTRPSDYASPRLIKMPKDTGYTPGQRAALFQTIRDYTPRLRETTGGQLLELLGDVGQTGLLINEQDRQSAIAKRAAKIAEAEKGVESALNIEKQAVERDKIISENIRSTIEAAVAAEESLQEAIKGSRSDTEITSRTKAVDRARRSAYAALQSEIERLGGDTSAIAALRQYVTDTGAAEGIQEAETVPRPTSKQRQTDNVLSRSLAEDRKTIEERSRTLGNATKRLDPVK